MWLGHPEKREQRYPRNVINNQKYNFFTFLPGVSLAKVPSHHPTPMLPPIFQWFYRRSVQILELEKMMGLCSVGSLQKLPEGSSKADPELS